MAMSVDANSLFQKKTEPYTARASVGEGGAVDASTSVVTGDREGGIFTPSNKLGKQDFLRLLVTQLQFQDPMKPMENTEFVAQLAQFSALEGNVNIEKAIGDLESSFSESVNAQNFSAQSMTNASAISMIGKNVRLRETKVTFFGKANETVPIRVHLGESERAVVRLLDKDGNTVRTLEAEGKDAENSATIAWDGLRDDGERAKVGIYRIAIEGQDTDPSLYAFVQDAVQGVRFTAEGPLIKAGGKELPIGNVMDVSIGANGSDSGEEG